MEYRKANSFGVIPVCKDANVYKILIVKNSKGCHWGLPKGTPEGNEIPLETAERELREETGIGSSGIRIQESPVFLESYSFKQGDLVYDKTNTYYLGFVSEMSIGKNLDEIDEVRWIPIDEAVNILSHQSVIDVISKLRSYLNTHNLV